LHVVLLADPRVGDGLRVGFEVRGHALIDV